MIEACYALRGRDRAIVFGGRVAVPLRDPAGDHRRAGDVTIPRADRPLALASSRSLIARCADAALVQLGDAWRAIGDVPASLARRVLNARVQIEIEEAALSRWTLDAPSERATRL